MKKLVVILLAISLFSGCFSVLAETQPAASTNQELLAALLERCDRQDIYFPSVSELYSCQEVGVNPGGDYSFKVKNRYGVSAIIDSISVIPCCAKPEEVVCSPYYATMVKNQEEPFMVNQKTAQLLKENHRNSTVDIVVDQTDYLCHYDEYSGYIYGLYRGNPAILGWWDYIIEIDGQKLYGEWIELVVQVSDDALVSVLFQPLYSLGFSPIEDLAEVTDLDFARLGDANLNGKVDAVDALAILQHAVGKETISEETAFLMADSDQSNTLDAKDALTALQIAVGK